MAFLNDTFTDTDGVLATAHTPETGGPYTKLTASSGNDAVITANRLRGAGTTSADKAIYYAAGIPAGAEYDVEADVVGLTAAYSSGVIARASTSVNTYYMCRYNGSTAGGTWELFKVVAGTTTSLGTFADPLTGWTGSPKTKHLKLQVRNTGLTVLIDGTSRITSSDQAITSAGRAGMRLDGVPTASTGIHLDNLVATDVAAAAPVNTVAPAITGTPQTGQLLAVSNGTWSNSPGSFAYQWKRDGVAISGATTNSYTLVTADEGHSILATVTATNAAGSASADSNAVTASAANVPANTVAPVISGQTTTGSTLSCSTGSWTNTPTGYTFQWKRDGAAISGATSSTYTLVTADEGHVVSCTVTAVNGNGSSAADSNGVVPVAPGLTDYLVYQSRTTGLAGTVALQILRLSDRQTVASRTTANITESPAGTGVYVAAVTKPPAGRYLVVWDEGSPAAGQVAVFQYTI